MNALAMVRRSCAVLLAAASIAHGAPGLNSNVVFDGYSPLAGTAELLDREMPPLWSERAVAAYKHKGQAVPAYSVDLGVERFSFYLPSAPPPQRGYGLVVFVPPWPQASVPRRWRKSLDEHGVIFVTAAKSGNDAAQIPRRMALALHGYANIRVRYPVDPERVYVAGFSGGARIALRLAIGYPDVFRGALLDGGSDPIGSFLVPLPNRERLHFAQEHLRLVYLYGSVDDANVERARYSMASARDACIDDVHKLSMFNRPHEPADAITWDRGLALLERDRPSPSADLGACRARLEAGVTAALERVRQLAAAGKREEARKALAELDARYAHLALPASIELSHTLPDQ